MQEAADGIQESVVSLWQQRRTQGPPETHPDHRAPQEASLDDEASRAREYERVQLFKSMSAVQYNIPDAYSILTDRQGVAGVPGASKR
jgi:hypothetical protein